MDFQDFVSSNFDFILSIYEEAAKLGFEASWSRIDGKATQWLIEVENITRDDFFALLEVAAKAVSVAA